MGRKVKIGKQRKDKFYNLAKDAGYRSRAAFKLIQLNRKFEFLQKARVLIDLCAAPGGWLQVAQTSMPVSSLIIGVDLVPIKAIPNVITIQEDITTGKCRQQLKRHLTTWKADVVLHDGAPNVGKSWDHDAFAQSQLTLHALKLASELLVKGGWFVTKVFRSKDYNALMWVFKKLFKKVHATKPQASRNESAEIFVICQHYTAPDKIDPKFLDPAHVFQDVDPEKNAKLNLFKFDSTKKAKAEGYGEGNDVLHKVPVSAFVHENNHLELLGSGTEIFFDDESIKKHPLTTEEILQCCSDLKVLGKTELKLLLDWKKKLKKYYTNIEREANKNNKQDGVAEEMEIETKEDDEEAAKALFTKQVLQDEKRKKKKLLKTKRKIQTKTDLKMIIKNDEPIAQEDHELFKLSDLKKKGDLVAVTDQDPSFIAGEEDSEENKPKRPKFTRFDKDDKDKDWTGYADIPEDSGSEDETNKEDFTYESEGSDAESKEETDDINPLIVDLENSSEAKTRKAKLWFDKESFAEINGSDFEDLEMDLIKEIDEKKMFQNAESVIPIELEKDVSKNDLDDTDSSSDEEVEVKTHKQKKKRIRLDPQGLALGSLMMKSAKAKRDIIDLGFNRYTNNDDNLPDWFTVDEEKHNRPFLPVSQEMVAEYRDRLKAINARPIKKVAEAKARKKKREIRKMDKARKKAEAVTENLEMSAHEKVQHIKTIYKNAMSNKQDKKVTYVFPKKGQGKRVRRPPGVKGKFKVVDRRMKCDNRKIKEDMRKKKGKKGKRPKRH